MKTVSLRGKHSTLDEVLVLAASGPVRILATNGRAFVLEEADDFDKSHGLAKAKASHAFSTSVRKNRPRRH